MEQTGQGPAFGDRFDSPPPDPEMVVINDDDATELAPAKAPSAGEASAPSAPTRTNKYAHPVLYPGLTWLLGLMIGVVLLRWFVPQFAEEIQYALTRGEQRAKYDVAGEHLRNTSLNDLSLAYQMVSQRVSPSVVHIGTIRVEDNRPADEDFRKLFGRLAPHESRGQGSGVIIDEEGYILTNYHVVHGARDIFVQLADGRKYDARRVGDDVPTDLAVLKIEAEGLIAAEWGDSDDLEVGSLVWAVGSPFGLDRSITSGILSAKDRRTIAHSAYQDFLQTDAAVNPGNSGGPLVNVNGEVVGINTAIIGDSFQGISFALAGNIAHMMYEKIREHGYVPRGWLGVALEEVTPELAEDLELEAATGAYIPKVISQNAGPSPAARAGLKPGDVVLSWNGEPIDGPLTLSRKVAQSDIGSTIDVVIFRDGGEQTLQVIVGERPVELD